MPNVPQLRPPLKRYDSDAVKRYDVKGYDSDMTQMLCSTWLTTCVLNQKHLLPSLLAQVIKGA